MGAMADRAPSEEQRDEAAAARGGRPRDPALDEAIIKATRRRLVLDGYSNMTIGDIAADAGVSRPTLYRRWRDKLELTIDALDYGLRAQRETFPRLVFADLPPLEAFTEAVRRVDPCYFNPDAMVLMGNFMGETIRTPELLAVVRQHAVEPRVDLVERVLRDLIERGEVRPDIDTHTTATLCFGAYYSAFLRGEADHGDLAARVTAVLWPGIAAAGS
jgi:AcrR family transcriptional regulator